MCNFVIIFWHKHTFIDGHPQEILWHKHIIIDVQFRDNTKCRLKMALTEVCIRNSILGPEFCHKFLND